jgi:hypothetical protein
MRAAWNWDVMLLWSSRGNAMSWVAGAWHWAVVLAWSGKVERDGLGCVRLSIGLPSWRGGGQGEALCVGLREGFELGCYAGAEGQG